MNVLDIGGAAFESACRRASQSLMRDARRQEDPAEMLQLALAAQYAQGYAAQVVDMPRYKMLAAFDIQLPEAVRYELSSIPDGGWLTPEIASRLEGFIENTANLHARSDIESGTIDCESSNFRAMAEVRAAESAGVEDPEVGPHTASLLRDRGGVRRDADGLLETVYGPGIYNELEDRALPRELNPYLRSFKQALEERGWHIREGDAGDVFSLTYSPMFPGVDPEFTVLLDMRGKDLNEPDAWIKATKDAAACDTVFWSGGVRKDEPGWIDEKIKRFKETELAGLPQLAEDAMAAAPWLDFTEDDVKVPEAAWAFEAENGNQCIAECHLTEDDDSPWGCAFYYSTYTFFNELGTWLEYDGGMFWGYRNADDPDLKAEALGACEYPYNDGDERRIDYGLLDIHGVWDEHGLPLTPDELCRDATGLDLNSEAEELRATSNNLDEYIGPLPDRPQRR